MAKKQNQLTLGLFLFLITAFGFVGIRAFAELFADMSPINRIIMSTIAVALISWFAKVNGFKISRR